MVIVSGLELALVEHPTVLEFDRRGKSLINIGDIASLELSRVWGLQLQPKGYSKTHFVDYRRGNRLIPLDDKK